NEAEHLPRSLADLCRQNYDGPLRVIFVDDASTDATPTITRAALRQFPERLTVVRNDVEPPPGWVGKCWAIHRGVRQLETQLEDADARTPWLCFTDADLRWHPQLLRTAMQHAEAHDADVVAVAPTLVFGGAWETIVQLQLMLALAAMLPFEKAMDPRKKDTAITGGAFILVKRAKYDEIGGHEAVKGEIVEDLQIGLALKRSGAKMRVALAGDLQWCRMYDGVPDMWEGLTKNAYAGLNRNPFKATALLVATLALNIAPMPLAIGALVWCLVSPSWIAIATCAAATLTTLFQARALNAVRKLARPTPTHPEQPHELGTRPVPARYAWTMPIGSAAYSVILLASMWHAHTRGNVWKGRSYKAVAS
ncbi:MAG: glycosyltransferase family 2 protein, partial [Planctomycetota bacterium]